MKRRDLLAGLLPVAVASLAGAQQPGKNYRIALVHPSLPVSLMAEHGGSEFLALFQELRRLGYEEGRNLKVERYSGGGQEETYLQLAKQVVATQPDLIFAFPVIAKAFAGRVPIVAFVGDPIANGYATSLTHPSGNVTGVVSDPHQAASKHIELIREVRPGVNHIAWLGPLRLWNPILGPRHTPDLPVRAQSRAGACVPANIRQPRPRQTRFHCRVGRG